jgi:hypothetical protein
MNGLERYTDEESRKVCLKMVTRQASRIPVEEDPPEYKDNPVLRQKFLEQKKQGRTFTPTRITDAMRRAIEHLRPQFLAFVIDDVEFGLNNAKFHGLREAEMLVQGEPMTALRRFRLVYEAWKPVFLFNITQVAILYHDNKDQEARQIVLYPETTYVHSHVGASQKDDTTEIKLPIDRAERVKGWYAWLKRFDISTYKDYTSGKRV